jgi:hypothetical protein
MSENPYQSPAAQPTMRSSGRSLRWAGTFLIVLAILPYIPMTITPLVAAIRDGGEDAPFLVATSAFNGTVMALLFVAGGWLRRRAAPVKGDDADALEHPFPD